MRALLLGTLLLSACDTLGVDAPPDPAAQTAWPEMLAAVNDVRAAGAVCGGEAYPAAAAVVWNDRLASAARRHSADMAAHDHFAHTGTDGSRPGDRARDAGYRWRLVAENIARRQRSVEEVVSDWVESPGHCRQLMDPRVAEMGVAETSGYWTQLFATPG